MLWRLKQGKILLDGVKLREKYKLPAAWELENKEKEEAAKRAVNNDQNQPAVSSQTAD